MAFQSMTGFSQTEFSDDVCALEIELRSVNGRTLDFRLKLPHEFSHLDQALRKKAAEKIQRGSIHGQIHIECANAEVQPSINYSILEAYIESAVTMAKDKALEAPKIEALMALPGVIHYAQQESSIPADKALQAQIAKHIETEFEKALDGLVQSRCQEGEGLITLLQSQIKQMVGLVEHASKDGSLKADVMRERLIKQVSLLIDGEGQSDKALDGDRLYQEVAILINRADVKEELDRLKAHIKAIEILLADEALSSIGKKLDFLAQELNREANTLCSKSISPSLSATGVELKTVIDQFREQVQNLQ